MSSEAIITAAHLSKRYLIYDRPQDRLKQSLFRGHRQYYREFWALRNVSFAIQPGEAVGIIGRNGSGKSTLLQLIAGTLAPTSGEIEVNGRVAALLELGSGFNPEFTGRENVFMNGAILGLSRREVEQYFDDIVAFADIGDFIDQPVKTYSSGMAVRLAFAVQAFVPKDILIVDEALAVGDELFQRKCFAKIEEFKAQGGTLLFVSHASAAVIQLCTRSLLLHAGELLLSGPSKHVVNLYQKFLYAPLEMQESLLHELKHSTNAWQQDLPQGLSTDEEKEENSRLKAVYDPSLVPASTVHYESHGAEIFAAAILTLDGKKANLLVPRQRYLWRYHVRFARDCHNVRCSMLIKTTSGLELGGAITAPSVQGIPHVIAGTVLRVEFEFQANLAAGTYFFNAGVLGMLEDAGVEVYMDRKVDCGVFKILHDDRTVLTAIVDFHVHPRVHLTEGIDDKEI